MGGMRAGVTRRRLRERAAVIRTYLDECGPDATPVFIDELRSL